MLFARPWSYTTAVSFAEDNPNPPRRRGRPPKTLPQGVDVRASLVDAAAAEIREAGWFATSTNRIAARAGLSSGVFYNYFSDKVDVLLAVYERWVADEWAMVRSVFSEPSTGQRQRIGRLVPMLIEHHTTWSRLRHALAVLARDDERVRAARLQSRMAQIEQVVRLTGRRGSVKLRTAVAIRLMMFEAVADSIAAGDAAVMGLDRRALSEDLATSLLALLGPEPDRA